MSKYEEIYFILYKYKVSGLSVTTRIIANEADLTINQARYYLEVLYRHQVVDRTQPSRGRATRWLLV